MEKSSRAQQKLMRRLNLKKPPQPSVLDNLMNGIGRITAIAAVSGYGAVMGTLASLAILVVTVTLVRVSWLRADPTGLIEGNPLDVVIGDNIATFDSTGFSAVCPSGTLNFCSEFELIEGQIAVINNHLNITNGSSITASDIDYNGYIPYYSTNVTDVDEALDDTSQRLYDNVISLSLNQTRFPAVTFPTTQIIIDEDIGRRLRIIETSPAVTPVTSLPASNITYSSVYPFNETNVESALDRVETDLLNIGSYDEIYVSLGGNDATCQFGILYACLTLNAALTKANASLASRVSIKIGAGVFVHPVPDTVPFRCGLDIVGQDANTYLEMRNPTMDAGSMNMYVNCQVVMKSFQLAILGNMNMTAVGTTVNDWRTYIENVTFVNSVAAVSFTGNAGFCWVNLLDVSSNGGISSITFTDMVGVGNGVFINNQVNINQITKNGFFQFATFSVGVNGFHVNNQMSSGTTYIFMHGGTNFGSAAWDFNTTAGGTTALRGDATIGMTNSGSVYGPIRYGSGTLTVFRETGISGIEIPRKNLIYHVSAGFGNDATCDGSEYLPCLTLYRLAQLLPNVSNQFFQITIMFDNGLYVESNYIAIKPNWVLAGNEIGTLLIFGAGAGLDGGSWQSTGTGFVSFLRFGLIRCDAACNFDMATAAPGLGVFSIFNFYNSSIELNSAPMTFVRGTTGNPYFGVSMESTTVSGLGTLTFQDMTFVAWAISGDSYSSIVINYNSSTTFNAGVPAVSFNGFVSHGSIVLNNYASGLIVDWSLMAVINRDSATLTRNYVSGASVNVHGDVLGLGVINGGLISTGAGSGTTEYLTKAPGLGYTPANTTYWGISGIPVQVSDALDKLVKRAYDLENTVVPQRYLVTGITGGAAFNTPSICEFNVNLNIGTAYIQGASTFSPVGGSALVYNGSITQSFLFSFDGMVTYSQSSTAETIVGTNALLFVNSVLTATSINFSPIQSAASYNLMFTKILTLPSSSNITLTVSIHAGLTTTFTTCGFASGFDIPFYSLTRYT